MAIQYKSIFVALIILLLFLQYHIIKVGSQKDEYSTKKGSLNNALPFKLNRKWHDWLFDIKQPITRPRILETDAIYKYPTIPDQETVYSVPKNLMEVCYGR